MAQELSLNCTINAPYLPITGKPRLVYLLLEVSGGTDSDGAADSVLPVNLSIVVDVSESMHVRLVTEAQFEELARTGVMQEVLVDGVPAWQSDDIPEQVLNSLPSKIDRVRDALWAAVEQLRPADRFVLVAFAGQAVTLIHNTTGADKRRLLDVVDGLDRLQLGDDTYIGRGIAAGLEELQTDTSQEIGRANV